MNRITEHARARAARRCKVADDELRAMQRCARPARAQELYAVGISTHEGSFYKICVWKGRRWVLVEGAEREVITIIQVNQ